MNTDMLDATNSIKLECSSFRYICGGDGQNVSFTDLRTGIDYCDHSSSSTCAHITTEGGVVYPASAAVLAGDILTLQFGDSGLSAALQISIHARYIVLEVVSVEGNHLDSLTFLSVPLKLKGRIEEPFGACAFALNTFTHVHELPTLQPNLEAACYPRFGVRGARIAVIGAAPDEMLTILREVVSNAPDLPSLRNAGAWAEDAAFNHGSYLFNFGTLTEETVDDWITMVKDLGFNQIDNHGGSKFFRFGDLQLNRDKWPDGWDSYKRIVARLHAAGISSIFHTYSFFIDKHSEFVSPVPSPQLDAFNTFTLSQPVAVDATTIYVNESTADISTITGFIISNSITLHIGDELVNFGGATKEPPYAFTGCTRGAFATLASAHAAGSPARHLKEYYGLFVPDCESPLFAEIARRHAEVIDHCDFDAFYLDAIDGSHILRGREDGWYWGQQFVFLIYQQLNKRVSMEMSAMWHQMWNLRSRYQAWDFPVRGYKRYTDLHLDVVKSKLQLPLQLGWWNFHYFQPPQIEPHHLDVLDYLGSKLIGYNAGISLTGAVNSDSLRDIPLYKRLVDRLKIYEDLRHSGYFNEAVRAQLREPGQAFTLCQLDNKWIFKPAVYSEHKVVSSEPWSSRWVSDNIHRDQPLQFRISALMSAGQYDNPANITLADLSANPGALESAQGVAFAIAQNGKRVRPDLPGAVLTAINNGQVEPHAAWARYELQYEPWLNLEQHQALGVWVYGDGHGEVINIRLESPRHLAMGAIADRYIIVDFTGWRYCELIETESARWSDYAWGDETNYYSAYRETIEFSAVSRLSVWFNNLPVGKQVSCSLSPIKALPMLGTDIREPVLTVNGAALNLPVRLHSGDYLELDAAGACAKFGPKGEFLGNLALGGSIPVVRSGANEMKLACTTADDLSPRVAVTIITHGEPLK